jgi:segregation and condensation protein B
MTERAESPFQQSLEAVVAEERVASLGAMLFVASEPVPLGTLVQQLGCTSAEARAAHAALDERLASTGRMLQWTEEDRVQLSTAPRFAPVLQRFLGLERTVRLSQAALETLAIVAYRQPVTRTDVEAVRGVDSSGVLQTLLARGLVEPVGRRQGVGNPVLYGITPEFLRFFGLTSLSELPALPEELAATLEERAAAAAGEESSPEGGEGHQV